MLSLLYVRMTSMPFHFLCFTTCFADCNSHHGTAESHNYWVQRLVCECWAPYGFYIFLAERTRNNFDLHSQQECTTHTFRMLRTVSCFTSPLAFVYRRSTSVFRFGRGSWSVARSFWGLTFQSSFRLNFSALLRLSRSLLAWPHWCLLVYPCTDAPILGCV